MLKFNVCGERHRAFAETVHLVIRTVNVIHEHPSTTSILALRASWHPTKTRRVPYAQTIMATPQQQEALFREGRLALAVQAYK